MRYVSPQMICITDAYIRYRYLTKITHQLIALISDKHSDSLVWKDDLPALAAKPGLPATPKLSRRVYSFGVERVKERRESVSTRPGSTVRLAFWSSNSKKRLH